MKSLLAAAARLDALLVDAGPPGHAAAALARTLLRRRRHQFHVDSDGDWHNVQHDGTIVSPVPHRADLRIVRRDVRDAWFYSYTPKPGDVVLDIGAGIGEDTLVFDELVRPTGRVYAVEAHPHTYRCLEKTVLASALQCSVPLNLAVADAPGTLSIADDPNHLGNSLRTSGASRAFKVEAVTVEGLVARHGLTRIDLLKMNIEGAERLAIDGIGRAIDLVHHVVISCHDFKATSTGDDWFATSALVRDYLAAHGFRTEERFDDPRPWIRYAIHAHREAST